VSGNGSLAGQVALVTGAVGGIGKAIMAGFREGGGTAVGFDTARAFSSDPDLLRGDVSRDEDVRGAVKTVLARHQRLDCLVHAAGITRDQVVWKLTPEDWDQVQQVNLRGAFLLLRHGVPVMREGGGGRVVLIGSINGSRGKFGQTAYAASKAGMIGLARSAARETGRFGIRVNVVEPGMVRTPMTEKLPEEFRKAAIGESLLGRLAEPEDIAASVLFLCGPGGAHITGQVIRVDGGQYL
jgi:3-oxoacyl-[acyl-carrier protein] reductase